MQNQKLHPWTWNLKFGYQSLCLVTFNTLVFFREAPAQLGAKRRRGSYLPLGRGVCRKPLRLARVNPPRAGTCLDNPLRFLAHLFMHLFRTCCESFRPMSLKVRSPGHVKWLHLRKKKFECSSNNYTLNARSPWNFQRLICVTVSIKSVSQNFHISDLRSGQFCDTIVNGRKMKAPLLNENHSKHSQTNGVHPIRSWPRPLVNFSKWPLKVILLFIGSVSTRKARCWQNKCRAFAESKAITYFLAKWLFLELLFPGGQTVNLR